MKKLKEKVVMKNALARAQQTLKLTEKRIIATAMAKIDSTASKLDYKNETARTIKINASDYQKTAKLKNQIDAYRDMMTAAKELINKQLTIKQNTITSTETIKINWIEATRYEAGSGEIEIRFTQSIMPYLVAIKDRFTEYQLKEMAGIKSIYTWRLIEFLTSWSTEKTGQRTIPINEFSEMMNTPTSYKTADVTQKIIGPTITELKKRGWEIKYKTEKTGRKITHITFSWRKP
ncbi:replication initiation protein [Thiolapillus sp.]|uniref:replication initiation protein n=1 Tax=Thiolapillus sp. TaxID=2017437 RepID=UPI003AF85500